MTTTELCAVLNKNRELLVDNSIISIGNESYLIEFDYANGDTYEDAVIARIELCDINTGNTIYEVDQYISTSTNKCVILPPKEWKYSDVV